MAAARSCDPVEYRGCDDGAETGRHTDRFDPEVQVPHRLLEVPGVGRTLHPDLVVGVGEVAPEAL